MDIDLNPETGEIELAALHFAASSAQQLEESNEPSENISGVDVGVNEYDEETLLNYDVQGDHKPGKSINCSEFENVSKKMSYKCRTNQFRFGCIGF